MIPRRFFLAVPAALLVSLQGVSTAQSQGYPAHAIKIVVPFPAGLYWIDRFLVLFVRCLELRALRTHIRLGNLIESRTAK